MDSSARTTYLLLAKLSSILTAKLNRSEVIIKKDGTRTYPTPLVGPTRFTGTVVRSVTHPIQTRRKTNSYGERNNILRVCSWLMDKVSRILVTQLDILHYDHAAVHPVI